MRSAPGDEIEVLIDEAAGESCHEGGGSGEYYGN